MEEKEIGVLAFLDIFQKELKVSDPYEHQLLEILERVKQRITKADDKDDILLEPGRLLRKRDRINPEIL